VSLCSAQGILHGLISSQPLRFTRLKQLDMKAIFVEVKDMVLPQLRVVGHVQLFGQQIQVVLGGLQLFTQNLQPGNVDVTHQELLDVTSQLGQLKRLLKISPGSHRPAKSGEGRGC